VKCGGVDVRQELTNFTVQAILHGKLDMLGCMQAERDLVRIVDEVFNWLFVVR
jgi:hypothetical protein